MQHTPGADPGGCAESAGKQRDAPFPAVFRGFISLYPLLYPSCAGRVRAVRRRRCATRSGGVRSRSPGRDHSDRWPEFVECGRQTEHRRDLNTELVVAAPQVPDERRPSDHDARRTVGLQPSHRPRPGLQPAVIALAPIVLVLAVLRNAAGVSSSMTLARAAARSVMTSTGERCAAKDDVKNRLATEIPLRRATKTSMAWPCWPIPPVHVPPDTVDVTYVSSTKHLPPTVHRERRSAPMGSGVKRCTHQ